MKYLLIAAALVSSTAFAQTKSVCSGTYDAAGRYQITCKTTPVDPFDQLEGFSDRATVYATPRDTTLDSYRFLFEANQRDRDNANRIKVACIQARGRMVNGECTFAR